MSNLKRRRSQDLTNQPEFEMPSYALEYDTGAPRSGKWTPEEERFANRLIHDFELGLLADCEDGCTLRSYLARKLNCAPMRISKKFAGKCIGKHVFAKKLGADRKMYANYYDEQQQQPMKYTKLNNAEDYYTYNYDFYRPREQCFQFESYSNDSNIPRVDSTAGSDCEHSDTLSVASNDFDNHSVNNNSDSEAEEWKDVLNFFCGWDMENEESNEFNFEFRDNQPIQFL